MNIHDEFAFRCSLPSRMLFHIIFMLSVLSSWREYSLIGLRLNLKKGGSDSWSVFISSRLPNNPLFELSRSQIIQLICVFISPQFQLSGYLIEIIIPRYLGLVCKILRYLSSASSPAQRLALRENAKQNILRSSVELMKTYLFGLVCGWRKYAEVYRWAFQSITMLVAYENSLIL